MHHALQDTADEFQVLWLLERNPAPELDQVFEPISRRRREKKAHAVAIVGGSTIDWIFCFRIVVDAVLGVQHAEERPVRRLEHAPVRKVDALPLARRYPASALLGYTHNLLANTTGKQQLLCGRSHSNPLTTGAECVARSRLLCQLRLCAFKLNGFLQTTICKRASSGLIIHSAVNAF